LKRRAARAKLEMEGRIPKERRVGDFFKRNYGYSLAEEKWVKLYTIRFSALT